MVDGGAEQTTIKTAKNIRARGDRGGRNVRFVFRVLSTAVVVVHLVSYVFGAVLHSDPHGGVFRLVTQIEV